MAARYSVSSPPASRRKERRARRTPRADHPTPTPRLNRPAGQYVERGGLFGDHNRVVLGQQEYTGGESDPVGDRGREAQGEQRVQPVRHRQVRRSGRPRSRDSGRRAVSTSTTCSPHHSLAKPASRRPWPRPRSPPGGHRHRYRARAAPPAWSLRLGQVNPQITSRCAFQSARSQITAPMAAGAPRSLPCRGGYLGHDLTDLVAVEAHGDDGVSAERAVFLPHADADLVPAVSQQLRLAADLFRRSSVRREAPALLNSRAPARPGRRHSR